MADDSGGGVIQLGEQFRVTLNGLGQPPPPNRLVGLLLLLLAESSPGWVSRRDIGESLYAGADLARQSAAVRQAISRLRRWLPGADVQTRRGAVRLAGTWVLDYLTARGDHAQGLRIAPGIEHPWMDAFRQRRGEGAEVPQVSQERLLFEAIALVARDDPEAARNLLCGASEIIMLLPETELSWLLGATRPKSRREPKASEHEALVGSVLSSSGKLRMAVKSYLRAYQIALQIRDFAAMASASSMVMFSYLELGDMASAAKWLTTLTNSDRAQSVHLLVLNAKSAFFWNNFQLPEALATMRRARDFIRTASRVEKAHFLSNLAVLEAECQEMEAALETLEEARTVLLGRQDRSYWSNLSLAEAEVLSMQGEYDRALSTLDQALASWGPFGGVVAGWYLREARAEVVHRQGASHRAKLLWSRVESERLRECDGLTPRVAARKGRVLG